MNDQTTTPAVTITADGRCDIAIEPYTDRRGRTYRTERISDTWEELYRALDTGKLEPVVEDAIEDALA